eukprot:gene6223-10229_t
MNFFQNLIGNNPAKPTTGQKLEDIVINKDLEEPSNAWFQTKTEEIEVVRKDDTSWFSNFTDQITTLKKKITNEEDEREKTWFQKLQLKYEGYITLSSKQRMYGFGITFAFGILNFILAFVCLSFILVTPRLFALFYTLGVSSLFLSSMFIVGPFRQIQSMVTLNRIIPSILFVGSLILTLYFSLMMKSLGIVFFLIIIQMISFGWYILTYLPFGEHMISMIWNTFTSLF